MPTCGIGRGEAGRERREWQGRIKREAEVE